MPEHSRGGRTVELYVRSLAPREAHQRQERVIESLGDLEERGVIDGFDVLVWGRALCPGSAGAHTGAGRTVSDRLDRIERWVEGTARSIAQVCRSERLESAITGECHEVVRLPSLALAEFDGDELIHFAPCRADRRVDYADVP
ncbi:HTH domain-containing protein [Halomarina litorea]|uniref:HTH domain-containing protein n=1 Tax=Halomarina litorea TaxID=2961595 RepID=UPI0020C49A67|nr:HTH domain-containing protein [Halomarina sp. BCD28]